MGKQNHTILFTDIEKSSQEEFPVLLFPIFVMKNNNTGFKRLCFYEFKGLHIRCTSVSHCPIPWEQASSAACDNRMNQKQVLINQIMSHKCLCSFDSTY